MNVIHHTFVLERSYPAAPEKVFGALADPEKKRRWFAAGNGASDPEDFTTEFVVGGSESSGYRFNAKSPFPGVRLVSRAVYLDIVPGERVVNSATMTIGDRRISASLVTYELIPNGAGTDLIFTHQGVFFEGSDGPERRQDGWVKLLERLEGEI